MKPLDAALRVCYETWPVRQRYLIGVSGGVDSVVLLHSLLQAGYKKLVICHLNHSLRGRTSAADARWVQKLAARLQLPCLSGKTDVRAESAAQKVSLETAGRMARHHFFATCARQMRCPRIFLGHHAGDQAETVLMNLCRGSAGATGMKSEASLQIPGFRTPLILMRPLLGVSKQELLEKASTTGWAFREDISNAVADVTRNRLRLEVLPLLDAIFQRPTGPALARAAAWTEKMRRYLQESAEPWTGQEKLRVREMTTLPAVLRDTVLAGWLQARGVPDISTAVLATAVSMLDPASGISRWNLPGNRFLRRRAGWLWVECVPPCGVKPD